MKIWKAILMALSAAVVSAALSAHGQEQPIAGDKRGNRCFNGRYWKDCGTPDAPVGVAAPLVVAGTPEIGWEVVPCSTNNCIANTLSSLSYPRSAEAKLTTWGNVTYVWYRR